MLKKVAILSSGSGSNAQALITHFASQENIEVVFVGSNRASAGVLERAHHSGVHHGHFTKEDLHNGTVLNTLEKLEVDWVLLAGFLLMVPVEFCNRYQGRMLNIHPSLLTNTIHRNHIQLHHELFTTSPSLAIPVALERAGLKS